MSYRSIRAIFTKSVIQVSLLALLGVGIATVVGGYLTEYMMRMEIVRSERKRLTHVVDLVVNREFDSRTWDTPGGMRAIEIYRKLIKNLAFSEIENLRKFEVWGSNKKLIWSSAENESNYEYTHRYSFDRAFEDVRNGESRYFIETIPGSVAENTEFGQSFSVSLISLIPLWKGGTRKHGLPDLVLKLRTEPEHIFQEMNSLERKVWSIAAGMGIVVFLMILGGVIWVGHLHESAKTHAYHLEIANSIAKAIGSTLEPDELFRIIVEEIRGVIPCDRCIISSLNLNSRRIHKSHYVSGISIRLPSDEESAKRGRWIYKNVYLTKSPLSIPDLGCMNESWARFFLRFRYEESPLCSYHSE